ncbi:MAG: hypothetical protein WCP10_08995 [Desulfuromonadales bacterium]
MSELISRRRWKAWRSIVFSLLSAAAVAGCGGDGSFSVAGVGTGGTGSLAKQVSGKVADGYLANATVFLDKNGNYQLDAGEPFTTTDENGAYKLDLDPADVGKYPIVSLAVKGVTIDKDTNRPVVNSYVLSMPKESVNAVEGTNFISPITTQLREMMETGIFATTQHAVDKLRSKMKLSAETSITTDYVAANAPSIHITASNIATLMGNQMEYVFVRNGQSGTVDVNRYRGMMGTIFSNMSSTGGTKVQNFSSRIDDDIKKVLSKIAPTDTGQPYRNMSSAYR